MRQSLLMLGGIFLCLQSFAQITPDTIKANQYYERAFNLMWDGKYPESNEVANKALQLFTKYSLWKQEARCYNLFAQNFTNMSLFQEAKNEAKKILSLSIRKAGPSNSLAEADGHTNYGYVQRVEGKYDSALWHFEKSLSIRKKFLREDALDVTECYSLMGFTYYLKGNYDLAIAYYQKAIDLNIRARGEDQLALGRDYHEISVVYGDKGDYNLALHYCQKVLTIGIKRLGETHPHIASTYNTIGTTYRKKGDVKNATHYLRAALQIRLKTFGENDLTTAGSYRSLGIVYRMAEKYDSALFFLGKALAINLKITGYISQGTASCYKNLGDAFLGKRQYDSAIINHQRSLNILIKIVGENHPSIANDYNSIGRDYFEKGNLAASISYFQKSMIANIPAFKAEAFELNPKSTNCLDPNFLAQSLTYKGNTLYHLFQRDKNIQHLKIALQGFEMADSLVHVIRKSHRVQSDKQASSALAVQAYEGAIQVCIALYERTKDERYAEKIFYYSEKSKSGTLRETLSGLSAKSIGHIPADLLALEKFLAAEVSTLQTKVLKEKTTMRDTANIRRLEIELFKQKRAHDSLITTFEKQFPQYYQLKYQDQILSLSELQRALGGDEAVVEYFVGETNTYILTVSNQTFDYNIIPEDGQNNKLITNLRHSLNPKVVLKDPVHSYGEFTSAAHATYLKFLKLPLEHIKGKKKLTLITDGALSYLPFEVLLTKPASNMKMDYIALDYLVNQFSIRYGYSATLLFNKLTRKKAMTSSYIAFAPSYEQQEINNKNIAALGEFRDQIIPLAWNKPEVDNIGKYLKGTSLTGDDAVETNFKSMAGNYRVIHLAMHALINDERPMESKLVFTQKADSIEDGYLNAYELYAMELPAELVVLSACETGFGKFEHGEGVMSLGQAFSYAGCPSIVMSHWLVDDESSSQLMALFYENLAGGMEKDDALQQAKQRFIKQSHVLKQSPAFWAGFVLIGDNAPLQSTTISLYWIVIIIFLFAVLLLFVFKKNKFDHP